MRLDLTTDLVTLLQAITDVESVSGNETELADMVEVALRGYGHLDITRDGDCVIARTHFDRDQRVDSLHDLEAGRAAGMRTVAVLTGVAVAAQLAPHADVVLPDIGALGAWIDSQA